ncbi:TraB/GumN family protein [Pseudoduganella sp. R-34]|uniref:TraB/GumN family protein n=1 Tax=Pseudoduganella sp. R-34 TaxID=3404062 RepID=UPI003CF3B20C
MLTRSRRAWWLCVLLAYSGARAAEGVPVLRVTAPNGQTSVLMATMHIGHPALRQPAPSFLRGARALVIEHLMDDAIEERAMAPDAMDSLKADQPPQAAWSKALSEAQKAELFERAKCFSVRPMRRDVFDYLFGLRSPRFMSMLASYPCIPMRSRDTLVMQSANAQQIPLIPLESAADIAQRRSAIPDRIYAEWLYRALSIDTVAYYGQLADLLNRGDYAAVLSETTNMAADPADNALYKRIMLDERNHAWIAPLRAELDAGNVVVLVGAAHLPGPDGLVALLQAAGYRLDPIQVPSAP